jgi:hypothetical protein
MSRRGTYGSRRGRSVAELLSDFGHQLPDRPVEGPAAKEERLFRETVGRRGRMSAAAGWSAVLPPTPIWRMTSEETGGLWPLVFGEGLPPTGAQMGFDANTGGAFHADPIGWVTNPDVPVTNPNVIVFGKPGRGKSGTIKMLLLRLSPYGYRPLILGDVKDEYESLSRLFDVEPFAVGRGMAARINPLDLGPLAHGWSALSGPEAVSRASVIFARWETLIRALVSSMSIDENRRVPYGPDEAVVINEAMRALTGYSDGGRQLRPVTMPQLHHALSEPADELIAVCKYDDRRQFMAATRTLRNAIGELVRGHLAGMFDAQTTIDVDWLAPIQSLSLSRVKALGETAVGVALMCLSSWGRAITEITPPGDLRIIVRDESWYQMRLGLAAVKALDEDLRLSRFDGAIQLVAAHKPSDMLSVGSADSQAVAIAKDLLGLIDVKVLLGQDAQVGQELAELLNLRPMAQDVVTGWCMSDTGRALWCVGERLFQVASMRTPLEMTLTYTNQQIEAA